MSFYVDCGDGYDDFSWAAKKYDLRHWLEVVAVRRILLQILSKKKWQEIFPEMQQQGTQKKNMKQIQTPHL